MRCFRDFSKLSIAEFVTHKGMLRVQDKESRVPEWKAALTDLAAGWITFRDEDVQQVDAAAMPEPFRTLLVHHEHMTTTLETYHGAEVKLEVLGHQLVGDVYRRMILLRRADTQQAVEFGIVRIHLQYVSPP